MMISLSRKRYVLFVLVLHAILLVSSDALPTLFSGGVDGDGKTKTKSSKTNDGATTTATTATTTTTTTNATENGSSSNNGNNVGSKSNTMMGSQVEANEYDDRTLLDTFGAVAKEYLTQRVIPDTDLECKWDWRFVRCEPYCECRFAPKRGDYHLGRSCRRRYSQNQTNTEGIMAATNHTAFDCDASPPSENPVQLVVQKFMRLSRQSVATVSEKGKIGYEKMQSKVCTDVPVVNCSESELPIIAWQQRLLCSHMIPNCAFDRKRHAQANEKKEEHDIHVPP